MTKFYKLLACLILSFSINNLHATNSGRIINMDALATCGTPTSLSANTITTTSATVYWSTISGVVYYNVRYRVVGTSTWTTKTSLTASKSLTGLTAGSNYEFQAQAVCTSTGVYSASGNFSTLAYSCGTPSALTATSITNMTATVSWAAVTGANSYNIQYRVVGTSTWTTKTSTVASKPLTGLTAGANYEFQVQAVCTINSAFSATANFTTVAYTCGNPASLAASAITTTTATVSWTAVSGATSYNIQYRIVGASAWTAKTSTTASKALTGLTAGSNYEFQVQAVCVVTGTFTASANFSTLPYTCGTPASLAASSITTTSATVSWTAVSGATSYNIQYRIVGTSAWTAKTSTTASKSLTGLTAGSKYEFQIQAICVVTGIYTASATFTTTGNGCGVPLSLSATSITANTTTLSWTAVSGATSYKIQYRIIGASAWTSATSTAASKSLAGLTAASNYEFQVQAICTVAGAFSASANFATLANTCGTPDSLTASSVTTTSASLSWTAVPGANSYNIQYRIIGSSAWISDTSASSSKSLTGLTAGSNYEFQVQAICVVTGAYSTTATFNTLPYTCGTPDSLTATSITTTSATLSWTAVSGANSYNIQYRIVGASDWTNDTSASASKSLSGLAANTNYEFQVQAVCVIAGTFSTTAAFATLPYTCGTPDSLTAASITTTSATLSWTAVPGANSYNIQYRIVGASDWTSDSSTTATKSLSGLTLNTNYEFQVQAVCVIAGIYSQSATFTTAAEATCGTPDSLASTSITTTSATLSWTAVPGANSYNIQYRIVGTSAWTSDTSASASKSLSGLTAESNYEFQVQAICLVTGVWSASATFTTLQYTCGTPDSLASTSITTTSATLSWTAVPGANSYNIQYRIVGTSAWTSDTSASASKSLSGLTAGNNYEFQVQAICLVSGVYSASATFTTLANSCGTPDSLSTASITTTSAVVSWAAVLGATSYNVQYRIVGSSTWLSKTTTSTSKTLSSLAQGSKYEFQIQAICTATGPYSASATFITLGTLTDYLFVENSAWKYLDTGTDQGTAWRASAFDDSTWKSGNTEMGYGDGDEATVVSYGPNAANKYPTTYFRKAFTVADPSVYGSLTLGYVRDDGIVVYINGVEVLRNNMPTGTITYNTLAAADAADEDQWLSATLNPSVLSAGNNEIAVEIHQLSYTSSDISFNARLTATGGASTPTCGAPSSLSAASITSSAASLSWTAVSGATSYNVQYRLVGTANWTTVTSATATASLSGLTAGSNYEFQVQAVCSATGSYSAAVQFTTLASGATTAILQRGAYLQKLTPTGITIRWRTDVACNSTVQYGSDLTYGSTFTDNVATTEHIVTLTGLTSNTKYFYSVGTSTQKLQGDAKNNFYTAPETGNTAPIRIWALGDFGTATSSQTAVRDAYRNYTGTTRTNLWLWLGDDAYDMGTDAQFQTAVFGMYPDELKSLSLFPAPGNHDYAEVDYQGTNALSSNFPYFSIFSVPQNGESGGVASNTSKYYSYNYGNVHFISLDSFGSFNSTSSPMYTWLNNDLLANTQRWTVVYFHHAPYTKGSHDSNTEIDLANMRTNIVPLLERFHVDVVLSGHSHNNERSYLMKGHYGSSSTFTEAMKVSTSSNNFVKTPPFDGTVYVVCGTSGGNGDTTQPGYPMPCMAYSNLSNACSLVIDVNADVFSCKYLSSTGSIVDQFTITKQGTAKPAHPAAENTDDVKTLATLNNAFNVSLSGNSITVNYTLDENSEVKIRLLDALGQVVKTFDQIPASQPKGDYNFTLPQSGSLADGLYFVEMVANGKRIVKKVYAQ